MWQLNQMTLGIDWDKLIQVLTYNPKQPMIFSSGLFLFSFLDLRWFICFCSVKQRHVYCL